MSAMFAHPGYVYVILRGIAYKYITGEWQVIVSAIHIDIKFIKRKKCDVVVSL